ncbi:MAG: hypothetical protein IKF68_04360 [Erysipelotrichaceae bacterium]|nr:hypothetical protein [Erysipelotrichaceae bacterium]
MKKLLKVLLVVLIAFSLCACKSGKKETETVEPEKEAETQPAEIAEGDQYNIVTSYGNVGAYSKYLTKVGEGNTELDYTYFLNEDTNTYTLWLDNNSQTNFGRAYINVFDGEFSEEPLYSSKDYYLIRPVDYMKIVEQAFDAEPAYYDLEQPEAYKLTYEESINYEFYYDSDPEIGYIIDAVYDGTLDEDLALRIAKKEYVIAVLTSLFEENIYIYENGSVEYEENQPVLDTAVYTAYLDFSAKTISLYTDNGETLVQTVGMD